MLCNREFSRICIQRPPKGLAKSGCYVQMVAIHRLDIMQKVLLGPLRGERYSKFHSRAASGVFSRMVIVCPRFPGMD